MSYNTKPPQLNRDEYTRIPSSVNIDDISELYNDDIKELYNDDYCDEIEKQRMPPDTPIGIKNTVMLNEHVQREFSTRDFYNCMYILLLGIEGCFDQPTFTRELICVYMLGGKCSSSLITSYFSCIHNLNIFTARNRNVMLTYDCAICPKCKVSVCVCVCNGCTSTYVCVCIIEGTNGAGNGLLCSDHIGYNSNNNISNWTIRISMLWCSTASQLQRV
jgi:hypothetical protein